MSDFQAGYTRVCITPPVGVELCGYGVYRERRSTGVADDLWAQAVVMTMEETQIALLACDLCFLPADIVTETRRLCTEITGIAADAVMISTTHTHSGPSTNFLRGWGEMCPDYLKLLPRYLCGAVRMASAGLKPARLGVGHGATTTVSMNRVEAGGEIDPDVGVLRIDRADGSPLAVIANFTCHGVCNLHTNTLIHRDHPGVASDFIRGNWGAPLLFLQGSAGDINPVDLHTGNCTRTGITVGAEILKALQRIETAEPERLAAVRLTADLPLNLPTPDEIAAVVADNPQVSRASGDDHGKWRRFYDGWAAQMTAKLAAGPEPVRPVEVQAFRIGETAIVADPAELFVEYGLQTKRESPFADTFVAGYSNDAIGYVPDPDDFHRAGYAADLVPRIFDEFPYEENVGGVLQAGMAEALRRLV